MTTATTMTTTKRMEMTTMVVTTDTTINKTPDNDAMGRQEGICDDAMQCDGTRREGTQQSTRRLAIGQGSATKKQIGVARIRHDAT
jgi:hypothetical protein